MIRQISSNRDVSEKIGIEISPVSHARHYRQPNMQNGPQEQQVCKITKETTDTNPLDPMNELLLLESICDENRTQMQQMRKNTE